MMLLLELEMWLKAFGAALQLGLSGVKINMGTPPPKSILGEITVSERVLQVNTSSVLSVRR